MIGNLGALLEAAGFEDITDKGDGQFGTRCPAHEERTGRRENNPKHFFINEDVGHCFSCSYAGKTLDIISYVTGLGLWDTLKLVRKYGYEEIKPLDTPVPVREKPSPIPTVRWLGYGSPPDRAIEKRNLSLSSIEKFDVRWEREEQAWLLPIKNEVGQLLGWQVKKNDYVRNYPKGVKKGDTLFGYHLLRTNVCIVVESPLDAVRLDMVDLPAVATFGSGWSERQMQLILSKCDELTLAFDNDEAGNHAVEQVFSQGWHKKFGKIYLWDYSCAPGAKDIGDMTDDQIRSGFEHKDQTIVYRTTKEVPRASGRSDVRRELPDRLPARLGKDSSNYRRSRKVVRSRSS